MPLVQCEACGKMVQVPPGGQTQCDCSAMVSAEEAPVVIEAVTDAEAADWRPKDADVAAIERLNDGYQRICKELAKVIVGQKRVIEELLIAMFARSHCLLVGVPGLAKTLMIRSLADSLNLTFNR